MVIIEENLGLRFICTSVLIVYTFSILEKNIEIYIGDALTV